MCVSSSSAALESGALVERSGVWHLEDRLPSTSRLLDLVEQRIGRPARARPVPWSSCSPCASRSSSSYLETAAPAEVLESLERAGLVTIARRRRAGAPGPPAARRGGPRRHAAGRGRGRSCWPRPSGWRHVDPRPGPAALRIAVWRLDAGGRPDPAVADPRRAPGQVRARLPGRAAPDRGGARRAARCGRGAAARRGAVRARRLRRGRPGPRPRPAAARRRARRAPPGGHPGQERPVGPVPARGGAGHQRRRPAGHHLRAAGRGARRRRGLHPDVLRPP